MKLAIVGFHNLHLMQFLYKYTDIFDKHGIDYDVIYWDRDMDSTIKYKPFNGRAIALHYKMDNYHPKHKKIIGFIKCIAFSRQAIKKGKYDKIIFLTTQSILPLYGIAKKYSGRYIYDYRDLTYEKNNLAKKLVQKLIDNSYMTCMSSMGFKQIIGNNDKIIVSHNCSNIQHNSIIKTESDKIRLVFWGMVRQIEFNKKICDCFGRDNRFVICYHGEGGSAELKKYCENQDYKNISFTGRYSVNEISSFAASTDILINLYENDGQQKLAMTVKYYDAVRYGLPMLVTQGSYMADAVVGNNAALAVNINNLNLDDIFEWYQSINKSEYHYPEELARIQNDDKSFEEKVLAFARN